MNTTTESPDLRELHDIYAERVNMAVDEGREDIVKRLVEEYEILSLKTLAAAARHNSR